MRTQLEALQEVRDRISYFCARTDGRYEPAWAKEIVGIIDDVLKSPRLRNCDKFPDVDEAYDQFMNYVKRENPSFSADELFESRKDELINAERDEWLAFNSWRQQQAQRNTKVEVKKSKGGHK